MQNRPHHSHLINSLFIAVCICSLLLFAAPAKAALSCGDVFSNSSHSSSNFVLSVPVSDEPYHFEHQVAPRTSQRDQGKPLVGLEPLPGLLLSLSQSERATIFFNLVDHPDMLLGRLNFEMTTWFGIARRQWNGGRFSQSVDLNFRGFRDEFIFGVIDSSARAVEGQTTLDVMLTVADPDFRKFEPMKIKISVPRQRGDPNFPADFLKYRNPPPDLSKFRAFFDWMHERDERIEYAKMLVSVCMKNLDWVGKAESENTALFHEREEKRIQDLKNMSLDPKASLSNEKPPAGLIMRAVSARTRMLDKIRADKLRIGYATGALSDSSEAKPQVTYSALRRPFGTELAPLVQKLKETTLVIDSINHYDTLANLQTVATKALVDMTDVIDRGKIFSTQATAILKQMKSHVGSANAETLKLYLSQLDAMYDQIQKLEGDRQDSERFFSELQRRADLFKTALAQPNSSVEIKRASARLSGFETTFQPKLVLKQREMETVVEDLRDLHQNVLNAILTKI